MKHNKKVDVVCEYCSKPFEVYYSRYLDDRGHFCSKECAILSRKYIIMIKECKTCQKEFETINNKQIFCSNICYTTSLKGKKLEEIHTNSVAEHIRKRVSETHKGNKYNMGRIQSKDEIKKRRKSYSKNKCVTWKGGRIENGKYIMIYLSNHPFSPRISKGNGTQCYMMEHRLVMECWLRENKLDSKFLIEINGKKYLKPEIQVHHINGKRKDNRIQNLVCLTKGAHTRHHNLQRESWKKMIGTRWFDKQ